jgi:hypothetical protein
LPNGTENLESVQGLGVFGHTSASESHPPHKAAFDLKANIHCKVTVDAKKSKQVYYNEKY